MVLFEQIKKARDGTRILFCPAKPEKSRRNAHCLQGVYSYFYISEKGTKSSLDLVPFIRQQTSVYRLEYSLKFYKAFPVYRL